MISSDFAFKLHLWGQILKNFLWFAAHSCAGRTHLQGRGGWQTQHCQAPDPCSLPPWLHENVPRTRVCCWDDLSEPHPSWGVGWVLDAEPSTPALSLGECGVCAHRENIQTASMLSNLGWRQSRVLFITLNFRKAVRFESHYYFQACNEERACTDSSITRKLPSCFLRV